MSCLGGRDPRCGCQRPTPPQEPEMPGRTEGSSGAVPRPLGPAVPCLFHQGPTWPAWQGHYPGSGSKALGPWALTPLPAMQGEVFGPPFTLRTEQGSPPAKSLPLLGAGPRCPHRYPQAQDPAPRQVGTIYANYVKYATLGTPMGSLCPSPLGEGAPAVAGLRLLGHDPIRVLWLITPSPSSMGPASPPPPQGQCLGLSSH